MSTSDLLGSGPAPIEQRIDPAKRLYRIAGLGGLGAALAWVGQPILVMLLAASNAAENPAWVDVEASKWNGAVEVAIFSGIGTGALFFVLATWRLIRLKGGEPSVAQQVGLAGGVTGALAWFLVAAESLRLYTSIGAGLPDITDDPELQRLAIEGTFLDVTGALVLFAIGFTLWTVLLATAARTSGVIGLPLAAVAGLTLLAPAAGLATPFGAPWWLIAYVLGLLVFGLAFLVKARKA